MIIILSFRMYVATACEDSEALKFAKHIYNYRTHDSYDINTSSPEFASFFSSLAIN
jgi:hypothetical protein